MKPESLRALVGAWPGVAEDVKWGADLVFSVVGKMFCVLDTGDSARLRFKVEDERFLEPTERPGVIPAPDLARARWSALSSRAPWPRWSCMRCCVAVMSWCA